MSTLFEPTKKRHVIPGLEDVAVADDRRPARAGVDNLPSGVIGCVSPGAPS